MDINERARTSSYSLKYTEKWEGMAGSLDRLSRWRWPVAGRACQECAA